METAVSESTVLSTTDKDSLSKAMLHDPETAQRYYVVKDHAVESVAINDRWQRFRQQFVSNQAEANPVVDLVPLVSNAPVLNNNLSTQQVIELIPTSALRTAQPSINSMPSLVSGSSSFESSPVREADLNTRDLASILATELTTKRLVPPALHSPVPSPSKGFTRRTGDWFCDRCFYDNFAYRTTCKNCNEKKGTKRPAEEEINPRPTKKTNSDIISVLDTAKNKDGEVIYKVNSRSKGITWLREKHIPSEMKL